MGKGVLAHREQEGAHPGWEGPVASSAQHSPCLWPEGTAPAKFPVSHPLLAIPAFPAVPSGATAPLGCFWSLCGAAPISLRSCSLLRRDLGWWLLLQFPMETTGIGSTGAQGASVMVLDMVWVRLSANHSLCLSFPIETAVLGRRVQRFSSYVLHPIKLPVAPSYTPYPALHALGWWWS